MRQRPRRRGEVLGIGTLLLVVPILFAIAVAPGATGTLAQVTDGSTLQAPLADEQAGQPRGAEPPGTEPAGASGAPAAPAGAPALAERSEPPAQVTASPSEPTATPSAPAAGMLPPPPVGPLSAP